MWHVQGTIPPSPGGCQALCSQHQASIIDGERWPSASPLRKRLQSHRNVICKGLTLDILSEEFRVRKNNDALIYRRVTGKL